MLLAAKRALIQRYVICTPCYNKTYKNQADLSCSDKSQMTVPTGASGATQHQSEALPPLSMKRKTVTSAAAASNTQKPRRAGEYEDLDSLKYNFINLGYNFRGMTGQGKEQSHFAGLCIYCKAGYDLAQFKCKPGHGTHVVQTWISKPEVIAMMRENYSSHLSKCRQYAVHHQKNRCKGDIGGVPTIIVATRSKLSPSILSVTASLPASAAVSNRSGTLRDNLLRSL
jgi:hypothetical protein